MAVDGIHNVIRMLEEIEDGRLPEADFLELSACTQGCVGGCSQCGESLRGQDSHQGACSSGLPVCRCTVSSYARGAG